MTRFYVGLAAVIFMTCSAVGIVQLLGADPEHAAPPHAARPTAGASAPLSVAGSDHPGEVVAYVRHLAERAWYEGVAEHERLEAERLEAERVAAARAAPRSGGVASYGGDCAALAAQFGLPEAILWRESRCGSAETFNASGCGGRGCVGPSQTDLGHYRETSPWGGPGGCADLDPYSIDGQAECTQRLSGGGTNLAPWR